MVSFVTVTELRYGALKAGWGDLRRRGLERDLARLVIVPADDELMAVCARLRARCEASGHGLGQKLHPALVGPVEKSVPGIAAVVTNGFRRIGNVSFPYFPTRA